MKKLKKDVFAIIHLARRFMLLGVFISLHTGTRAQQETPSYFKEGISPQVALMNQYGDYPVDLMNGLVDITIPLYSIQTTSLSMPLALKFHASGLKANEREGLLGIRWALSGLGHVTRNIKGYPDDYQYPFNGSVKDPNHVPTFNDLYGTTSTLYKSGGSYNGHFVGSHGGAYKDTEHDIYSYCLPSGKAGKFIIEDGKGYSMPYEPMKFFPQRIVDENGIEYSFGGEGYQETNQDGYITTWYLNSIVSANKKDTILIDYDRPNFNTTMYTSSLVISHDLHDYTDYLENSPLHYLWGENLTDPQLVCNQKPLNPTYQESSMLTVKSIIFRSGGKPIGKVSFNYRSDEKHLDNILVQNALGDYVKEISFYQNKNKSAKFMKLDSLAINGNEKYKFEYYDNSYVSACGEMDKNSDWYGYYSLGGGWFQNKSFSLGVLNIGGGGTHTVPFTITGGTKSPDKESMEIGMIKSIQYPTGGKSAFIYEANQISGTNCGGLRINTITNESELGAIETKTFTYAGETTPIYLQPPSNTFGNYYEEHEIQGLSTLDYPSSGEVGHGTYLQKIFLNTFPSRYTEFHSNTIRYGIVTELLEDSKGNQLKTVYKYNSWFPSLNYFQSLLSGDFKGYTGYYHGCVSPTDFWKWNKLIEKTIYKGNTTNKVKEYKYNYNYYNVKDIYDLPVFRYRKHEYSLNSIFSAYGTSWEIQEVEDVEPTISAVFAFVHQKYTIGTELLSKVIEKTYANGDSIVVTKDILYDAPYFLPEHEIETNSNGLARSTNYQYPFNFIGDDVYEGMIDDNILTPVIEKSIVSDTKSWTEENQYSLMEGYYYPSAKLKQGKEILVNNKYSSQGRPLHVTVNNVKDIVYLWGYNQQYPVAVIVNATYQQVCEALGGESYLNSIANANVLSSSDLEALDNLRAALPNATVTTSTYAPLIGKLSETAPNGTIVYYGYYSDGRLKEIYRMKNGVKEIIESYDYNYVNN